MVNRSDFLGASLAMSASRVLADSGGPAFDLVEKPGEFDLAAFTKRVSRPAEIRQVWDAGKLYPQILGGVKNSLNGLQFGFHIAADEVALAFVTHNESNVLLYGSDVWARYNLGQVIGVHDPSGAVVSSNIFAPARSTNATADPSDVHGYYQDASIATLQRRGVMFFICNTALVQQARQIVDAGAARNETADQVARALRGSLLPGAMLVPSGVATIALLQSRHHYAYITE
jgi:intracellular sulfur oxidation DsrE/DsrF family protein